MHGFSSYTAAVDFVATTINIRNPVVPLFGTRHKKGKYWIFLKNQDRQKNVMDKIWDRNPSKSEVIGCCGGDEKTNDHAELTKVEH